MVAEAAADGCLSDSVFNAHQENSKVKLELDPTKLSCFEPEINCSFVNFVKYFLEEVLGVEGGIGFPASPPMLGGGQSLDLLKLFSVVRERGGYHAVSRNGLWGLVAEESGVGSGLDSSVKLVYSKYLDALKRWLETLVGAKDGGCVDEGGDLTQLGSRFGGLAREFLDSSKVGLDASATAMRKTGVIGDEESAHGSARKSGKLGDGMVKSSVLDSVSDGSKECKNTGGVLLSDSRESARMSIEGEGKSAVMEIGGVDKCSGGVGDHDKDDCEELDSNVLEGHISSRKRKRDSMCKMLHWLTGIARDPCDSEVGFLPERSNWSSYGQEEIWKQVLLAREELFLKRNFESGAEQSAWQKIQKMHPSMYDDHIGSSYNLRDRLQCTKKPRLLKSSSQAQACSQASSSASQTFSESCIEGNYDAESSTENAALDLPAEKYIPLGPRFQAEVPEWTGVISQSDSKWIGTKVWPLVKPRNELLVEREPIGKGRDDSCGCQVPKSIECVRFHCTERKLRMKRELGLAYHHWRFDKMGEEVKLFWTKDEENKFKDIVRLNPLSHYKCFWDEMIKCFPTKSREDLVSYYFNVFLLQRRADQNRLTPNAINSDDDESEYGLITKGIRHEGSMSPGSLLYSAKKQRKN